MVVGEDFLVGFVKRHLIWMRAGPGSYRDYTSHTNCFQVGMRADNAIYLPRAVNYLEDPITESFQALMEFG